MRYRATLYGTGEAGGQSIRVIHFDAANNQSASAEARRRLGAGVVGVKAMPR